MPSIHEAESISATNGCFLGKLMLPGVNENAACGKGASRPGNGIPIHSRCHAAWTSTGGRGGIRGVRANSSNAALTVPLNAPSADIEPFERPAESPPPTTFDVRSAFLFNRPHVNYPATSRAIPQRESGNLHGLQGASPASSRGMGFDMRTTNVHRPETQSPNSDDLVRSGVDQRIPDSDDEE